MSSTLSTPTTQPQSQQQTSTSAYRQQATFQPVSSAHMSQQASYGSMMSNSTSGAGGCDPTLKPENTVPSAVFPGQRPRSMPEISSMQSQQFTGYGAAYHGGYSGSHAGSHTGTWATEGPSAPALHVHQSSSSGQSRSKPVTTSTVVSGEQEDSLLDITLSDPVNLPPITSPSDRNWYHCETCVW